MKKFVLALSILATMLAVTSTASAQSVRSFEEESSYGYEFADDPLNAGGFGPNDATILVRPGPVRAMLIRPRLSFVNELLKSVEDL